MSKAKDEYYHMVQLRKKLDNEVSKWIIDYVQELEKEVINMRCCGNCTHRYHEKDKESYGVKEMCALADDLYSCCVCDQYAFDGMGSDERK